MNILTMQVPYMKQHGIGIQPMHIICYAFKQLIIICNI